MNLAVFVGIKVSAYRKIPQVGKSADSPNSPSVSVLRHFIFQSIAAN
jgi:hypothetical protein